MILSIISQTLDLCHRILCRQALNINHSVKALQTLVFYSVATAMSPIYVCRLFSHYAIFSPSNKQTVSDRYLGSLQMLGKTVCHACRDQCNQQLSGEIVCILTDVFRVSD